MHFLPCFILSDVDFSPHKGADKGDFLRLYIKLFSRQCLQRQGLRAEIKAELIGIQRLIRISRLSVCPIDAVLTVAEQRMTDMRKVRADLMRSSGQ